MLKLNEIFMPLNGFKGCEVLLEKYHISNYGKVYDILNHRFMKLSLCGEPLYYYVTLSNKGVRGTYRINRLVALSFIENPNKLPVVDHIDRDRLNNYVGNLRWVTKRHNCLNNNKKYIGIFKVSDNSYNVIHRRKYYGCYSNERIAAKIFDVITNEKDSNPIYNFPAEDLLCSYGEIHLFNKTGYKREE